MILNPLMADRLKMIYKHYGFTQQQNKLVEECEELVEAAQGEDWDRFIMELADVTVMIEQMKLELAERGVLHSYYEAINQKINRTFRHMAEEINTAYSTK